MRYLSLMLLAFCSQGFASQPEKNCQQAMTTLEIVQCKQVELEQAEAKLTRYFEASLDRYQDPEVHTLIDVAQQHWLAYRKASCDAQYQIWRDGLIRVIMAAACLLDHTEKRTLQLWQDYLTFMDNAQPILPDPRH